VPELGALPSTNASSTETKVTDAALNFAGTGAPDGCVGFGVVLADRLALGFGDVGVLAVGLTEVGEPDGVALPADPQPATETISARQIAGKVRVRELTENMSTSLSLSRT
jgi:hypothetical protein